MNFFDSKAPRYSKQHISRTNTIQRAPIAKQLDSEIPPDHIVENVGHRKTSQEAALRRLSVAPIRSLSIRQQPQYPSSAELGSSENNQKRPTRELRATVSGTILATIQKLEGLLGDLDQIAVEAEDIATSVTDPPALRRASTRLSPGIKLRAASLPLQPPVHAPEQPRPLLGSMNRHVTFSDNDGPKLQAPQPLHTADGIRACDPVHLKKTPYKAAAVPAELTGPGEDFEMKLLRRRRQSESHFHEHFSPNPPPPAVQPPHDRSQSLTSKRPSETRTSMSRRNYKRRVKDNQPPPVLPRTTSIRESSQEEDDQDTYPTGLPPKLKDAEPDPLPGHERHYTQVFGVNSRHNSIELAHQPTFNTPRIDLRRQRHVDVRGDPKDFDLHQMCNHAPVARDWPTSRKRFTAIIACLNAACIGMVIGIYSGEVPAIQYVIVDFHHYTILGNVFLYCAMAIPTFFLWPLPLLHGRKVYTVAGLAVAMASQIPQAVAVSNYRSPDVASYRQVLFIFRALSGFAFGFVIINIQGALLDCFGASLQSQSPHGESLDPYDVRRHGGGMGLWLGVWSFASLAAISSGFMIGAFIINNANVMWGFWTCFVILLGMLLLNIIAPEVRRSAYRRTLTEMHGKVGEFSRVTRGEVRMHMEGTGPYWWGEEVLAGIKMNWLMVQQPGFLILATYTSWVYAQYTMILMVSFVEYLPVRCVLTRLQLLGALASRYYLFKPIPVGLCVLALTLGAVFAVPFEKASWLSRSRYRPPRTDSMTTREGVIWSSHMLRRMIFTVLLPLAALASTLTSKGPPLTIVLPCFFAAMVGFLSTLAIAECFGLIMETFDTSDLQPGMTGRPARRSVAAKYAHKRTNFSCYPRVSAGYAVTQTVMYIFAATATGVCGRVERRLGAMVATACVAAVLLFLTLLLTVVLMRVKTVKMIPDRKPQTLPGKEDKWEPLILGNPSGTTRKISLLEAGRQTRWSEIRKRNRLDEQGLTGS